MSKHQACIAAWLKLQAQQAAAQGDNAKAVKATIAADMVAKGRLILAVVR